MTVVLTLRKKCVSGWRPVGAGWTQPKETPMTTKKVGRDAGTGQFIPVKQAQQNKKTSVVETVKTRPPAPAPKKPR